MPAFVITRARGAGRQHVFILSLFLLLAFGAVPAQAQDIFGLFRLFSRPAAPAPTYQSPEHLPVPAPEKSITRSRSRAVRIEQPAIKMPLKPKAPGEIANPVPELLNDSSLRPGDMVMFPDGLRVFTGRTGSQHRLTDFEPVDQAAKAVPPAVRKLAAHLRPGMNPAWNEDSVRSGGKLAANTKNVETTGKVTRRAR